MTPDHDHYQAALDSGEKAELEIAYSDAQRRAFDLRFTAQTRKAARDYLPRLTAALRASLEEELAR